MTRKTHVVMLLAFLALCGCQKNHIYEEFEKPIVLIKSSTVVSANERDIEIGIDLGVGATIKDAYLDLTEIAEGTPPSSKYTIKLTSERAQTHTLRITVAKPGTDYTIRATLVSEKNEYNSEISILHFSKTVPQSTIDYIELYVGEREESRFYDIPSESVRLNLNRGENFMFIIHSSVGFPSNLSVTCKLNGEISVPVASSGDNYRFGTIAETVHPGIYSIHVYIEGEEYILADRLRVLSGSFRKFTLTHPYGREYIGNVVSNFVFKDALYYIYDLYPHKLLTYTLNTQSWNEKQISFLDEVYKESGILTTSVACGNAYYFMVSMVKTDSFDGIGRVEAIVLWKFDPATDTWTKITDYPGEGDTGYTIFSLQDKIYVGGGVKYLSDGSYNVHPVSDFWEFDTAAGSWTKKRDLPYQSIQTNYINSTASNQSHAYAFTMNRELFRYTSQADQWEQLESLKSGPYYRFVSQLVFLDNKLYLTGGLTYLSFQTPLRDTWEYDLLSNQWILRNIHDVSPYFMMSVAIPTVAYQGKIYWGYARPSYGDDVYLLAIQP